MAPVLVTGAAGMLGSAVVSAAPVEVLGIDRADVDLADPGAVAAFFRRHGPFTGVIHCAGYTDVDGAETHRTDAHLDNTMAAREVAAGAAREVAPLVLVSTDYVFDGASDRPYREDDPTGPRSVYGETKLAGERAARSAHPKGTRIVRTAWLYGPGGRHFPGRILELASERDELKVVDDQRGSPTSTLELAPVLWDVLQAPPGIYHATCSGECTWYGLARATLELAGIEGVRVTPCTTAEFPRPAPRPANSTLDCSKLAALRAKSLAPWRDALAKYLEGQQ